jgi:SNF2 family DNA or RNA helicase
MSVNAGTDGKRILIQVEPFSDYQTARVKIEIPGSNFRKSKKDWSAPLTIDTCRTLRKVFGADLRVKTSLAEWARQVLTREAALEAIRNGETQFDFERVPDLAPDLWKAIQNREYQPIGAAFMWEAQHSLLGDQPGLGKTLQTLATLLEDGAEKILVACPRTATRNVWQSETARWAPTIETYVAQGSREERQKVMNRFSFASKRGGQHMLIINTEMMRINPEICPDGPVKKCGKEVLKSRKPIPVDELKPDEHQHLYDVAEWPSLTDVAWDAIVIDEAHNSLASTSNTNSKNITQVRYGAMHLRRVLEADGLAIAMSGTPFRSKLAKSWGTLNWLNPVAFPSFWQFAETHFGVDEGEYSNTVNHEPKDEVAFRQALAPYYLARRKEDVAKDLPPKLYMGDTPPDRPEGLKCVFMDMDPRQARAYEDMRKLAIASIQDGTITAVGNLAEMTRMRQFACSYGRMTEDDQMIPALPSNKIDWLIEFLLEREGNDGKVVVASSFSRLIGLTAAAIEKELKTPVLTLTGATTDRGRTDLVRRFADPKDPARVAIINSRAGGEAITLDAADDMVFLDVPWTSDEATQVEDRIHRVSRIHNVFIYRLMSLGTIDEKMAGMTDDKRRILQAAQPKSRNLILEALS